MPSTNALPRPTSRQRPGTVYIAVLGVTLMVALMVSVAISLVRIERRVDATYQNVQTARWLARSAAEFGAQYIANDANWRTTLECDTETTIATMNGGTSAWRITDTDDSLTDDLRDCVTLSGIGLVDEAVSVEQVMLMPTGSPITSLEVALLVDGDVALVNGTSSYPTNITTDQTVGSNGDLAAGGGNRYVSGNAEAAGEVSGTVTGTSTSDVAARDLPGDDYLAYYKAVGTWIPIESLPTSGETYQLCHQVLSPANNPYGATNPEGIYVIDCQGATLQMYSIRVVGTLVILNPGSDSGVTSCALLQPAVDNYPALLVDGDFTLSVSFWGYTTMTESFASTNYNPAGTPYEGEEDDETDDVYNAGIFGLAYINGTANVTGKTVVDGCLICNDLTITTKITLTVNYDQTYLDDPPPGFAKGDPMQVIPGTWQLSPY